MHKLPRRQLELKPDCADDFQYTRTVSSCRNIISPAAVSRAEFTRQPPKREYQSHNFGQDTMGRCRSDYLSPTSTLHAQRKRETENFKQTIRAEKVETNKLEALNKVCEAYKEDIQQEIKELQKQLSSPNAYEKTIDCRNPPIRRPVLTTFAMERADRPISKETSSRTSTIDSEDVGKKEVPQFGRRIEEKENYRLKDTLGRQPAMKTRSISNSSRGGLYEHAQNSSGNNSIILDSNSSQSKLSNLKGSNGDRKSNAGDAKKVVRFSHTHSESSDVGVEIKTHSDPFNYFSHEDCRKVLAELSKIYNTGDIRQIVPYVQKTERIIKLLPKMEKMLTEVHNIVFPEADPNEWSGNLDKMTATLRKWSQNNKSVNELLRFRSKLASVIGCDVTRTKDEEIVAKVKALNVVKTDRRNHHSDPNAEKFTMFFEQFRRLFKTNDTENALSKLNQIYRQHAELDNFKLVVSTYLNIDENIKLEDFLKVLMESIENMKFSQQRSHGKIVESIQQQLGTKDSAQIITKLTRLLSENKASAKMKF